MLAEADVRHLIGSAGAQTLVDVIGGAWAQHQAAGRPMSRRGRASDVFEFFRADSSEFARLEGVQLIWHYGSPLFLVRESLAVRFKKLDRSLLSSNIRTATQVAVDEQGSLPGLEALPIVTAGYVLDRAEASIELYALVRAVCREVEWYIDLQDLAAGEQRPLAPILPIEPTMPMLPAITVRRVESEGEGTA